MFNYYFDSQNGNYYKWGTNEKGKHAFYHLYNNKEWIEISICGSGKQTGYGWEYDLQPIDTTSMKLSTFNNYSSITLSFFTPSSSSLFGTTRSNQLDLINKELVPFQDETAKDSGRTTFQKPAPTTQPSTKLKTYSLNPNQTEKLRQHKKMLEERWFERRIHDYLFFCQGRTKTEKINEITKLLKGEACDPDVVEQGRTGKILKK